MKYFLKEHVTNEMLEQRGLEIFKGVGTVFAYSKDVDEAHTIYIPLNKEATKDTVQPVQVRQIVWNYKTQTDDIKPYIQFMIDIGWVKEIEKMIEQFKTWCLNKGFKAHKYKVLHKFVEGVKQGDIQKCDVCGEYQEEEHLTRARFDYEKDVCPDCERDGN